MTLTMEVEAKTDRAERAMVKLSTLLTNPALKVAEQDPKAPGLN